MTVSQSSSLHTLLWVATKKLGACETACLWHSHHTCVELRTRGNRRAKGLRRRTTGIAYHFSPRCVSGCKKFFNTLEKKRTVPLGPPPASGRSATGNPVGIGLHLAWILLFPYSAPPRRDRRRVDGTTIDKAVTRFGLHIAQGCLNHVPITLRLAKGGGEWVWTDVSS